MAKIVVKQGSLFLGSLQLSSNVSEIGFSAEAEVKEATSMASAGWEVPLQGIRKSKLTAEVMLENIAEPETTLNDLLENETDAPFTVTMTHPPAAGNIAYFTKVVALTMTRKMQVGELWGGGMDFGPRAEAVRGQVLDYVVDLAASANGGYVELSGGVATGERLWLAVHVIAAGGTPTLDLELESDVDNTFSGPTARITLDQFTDVGSYIGFVDGPITDEFFRIPATVGGSSPELTYLVVIGIAPAA